MKLFTKVLVRDIMTPDVITIRQEYPLPEIASILHKHRIHGAPVVDAENKVIGIVTESDFFLREDIYMRLPTLVDIIRESADRGRLAPDDEAAMKEIVEAQAADVMSAPCITVRPDTPAGEAINIFSKTHYKTLPVVDAGDRLVGVVSLADVLNVIQAEAIK